MSIQSKKVNSIPVIFLAGLIFLLFSPLKILKSIEAIGLKNTKALNAITANKTNQQTLKVWFTSTKETGSVRAKRNEVYEEIIAKYNRQATVKVEREVKPSDGWIEEIKRQGKNNNLPCIFELDAPISYEFIEKGWLAPINLPAEIKQDLMPPILEQGTYRDSLYFIGLYDVGLGLWGNKKQIERANQILLAENKPPITIPKNLENAWTEEEFIYALKALKRVTSGPPLNIQLHYGSNSEWLTYGFLPILQSYGADIVDRNNYQATGTLDGEITARVLKKLQDWIEQGYIAGAENNDSFEKGEAALSYVGTWKYEHAKEAIGSENLVLIPMPKFGDRIVVGMGSWAWAMSKSCPNKEAARDFLLFTLQPENLRQISDRTGLIPARKSAARGSVLYDESGQLYLLYQQLLESAKPRPKTPYYPIITLHFREVVYGILAEMKDVDILGPAAQKIDAEIEIYQRQQQEN